MANSTPSSGQTQWSVDSDGNYYVYSPTLGTWVPRPEDNGKPDVPAYQGSTDPATGLLKDSLQAHSSDIAGQIQSMLSGVNPDMRGMEAFRHRALDTGPSAWLSKANQLSQAEQRDAISRAASAGASSAATARSGLAMRGGLSSGARERIQRDSMREMMGGTQEALRQGDLDRQKLGIQDEQMRQDALSKLPGMENQLAGLGLQKASINANALQSDRDSALKTSQFNISNSLSDLSNQNQYNMTKYGEDMKAWAANKDADAQKYAADKEGASFIASFICTELLRQGLISMGTYARLGKLMVRSMFKGAHFIEWYFTHGPTLVARNQNPVLWNNLAREVDRIAYLYGKGKMTEAQVAYAHMVRDLNESLGFPAPILTDDLCQPDRERSKMAYLRILETPVFSQWVEKLKAGNACLA